MGPATFCRRSRVVIVAGKGGVGKTTVAATLATMAARAGIGTLVVDVEGTGALPALFGREEAIGYEPVTLVPAVGGGADIRGVTVRPDDALVEYLETHGLARLARRLGATGTLELVATAIPGLKDLLVLGKIRQLAERPERGERGAAELVVVDGPAAGHAVTFLTSARGLLDAVTVGPIRAQAEGVAELLSDPARCQVLLVTLPEETPVNETVETADQLEDRAGVTLGPVVVNGLFQRLPLPADPAATVGAAGIEAAPAQLDALREATELRRRRQDRQAEQVERLALALPLPQLRLPNVWRTDLGPAEVAALADALAVAVEGLQDPPATAAGGGA